MSRPGLKQLKFSVSIVSFLLYSYFAFQVSIAFAADKQQSQENLNGKWKLTFDPPLMLNTRIRRREQPITLILSLNPDHSVKGNTGWSYVNSDDGISGQPASIRGQIVNHQVMMSIVSSSPYVIKDHDVYVNLKGSFIGTDEVDGVVSPGNCETKPSEISRSLPQSGRFKLQRE